MDFLKVVVAILMAAMLVLGCGQNGGDEAEKTPQLEQTAEGVKIAYTMIVSGMPMMGDLTFKYVFRSDGVMGRMDSESIITAGDQTRTSYLSYVTNVEDSVQIFMNSGTKTYAVVSFPNPSDVPPVTSTDMEVSVEPTGETQTHVGNECETRDLLVNLPLQRQGQISESGMSGTLCVSNDFPGYDVYRNFMAHISDAVLNSRLQGSGYLEFLNRFGLTKENLETLYAEIGGFPLTGELTIDWHGSSDQPLTLVAKIDVTEIEAGPLGEDAFVVPEDYTEVDVGTVLRSGS